MPDGGQKIQGAAQGYAPSVSPSVDTRGTAANESGAAFRPFSGRDLVIPADHPDHDRIVRAVFRGLSAGALPTPPSPAERRRSDLANFGPAFVEAIESVRPDAYREGM